MSKKAIEKAKKFLQNMGCCDFDEKDAEIHHDFSYSNKPYFVYNDVQGSGYWMSQEKFCSKSEINKLIEHQFHSDCDNKWDHVYILDVKKNRIVKPKV